MNARLDLLAPSLGSTCTVQNSAALCCDRYIAGEDMPPALPAAIAVGLERAAEWLVRALREAMARAGALRA